MFDWLIVGGGIHGTAVALYLTRVRRADRAAPAILDPHDRLLARWNRLTRNVGMGYLRSPQVQNLDHDPWSISTFARTRAGLPLASYIPTHNRPSLVLFRAHCDWLIARHNLAAQHIQGRASGLMPISGGWRLETTRGPMEARHVVVAIGSTALRWPGWTALLRRQGAPVYHVFDAAFRREALPHSRWVVVGGGISAAQLALSLSEEAPGTVTLLMRHPVRVFPFDSDLAWVAGDRMQHFRLVNDYAKRRRLILAARHAGSMPAEVAAELRQAERVGSLRVCTDDIVHATVDAQRNIALRLEGGERLETDGVILATGFESARPGGLWLDRAIERLNLPVAACGYPIVDDALAWQPGLHVTGPLAELEVGPVARNIIGARFAAERIGRAVR